MPWPTKDLLTMKHDFVQLALLPGANIRELSRRFGISAPCAYKWLKRYRERGVAGLEPLPRRRLNQQRTSTDVETLILDLRRQHPAWGARKLRRRLHDLGHQGLPSPSTITEILRRHHLLEPQHPSAQGPWQRFTHAHPNDLWQMDFKGDFALHPKGRCFPLTILDDHSRYALALQACADQRGSTVREHLERVFQHYGLPLRILCDNGSPWGGPPRSFSILGVWLLQLGVDLIHGRPFHPQTQGKDERFHRTLKAELLDRSLPWTSLAACQTDFTTFRSIYNLQRPHHSLNLDVPAAHYRPSHRSFPASLSLPEYLPGDLIRTVKSKGEITFQNHFFYVGGAFAGLPIALRPSALLDGLFSLHFAWKCLGSINLHTTFKTKFRYHPIDSFDPSSTLQPVNDVPEHPLTM
jgi:transposase InsO family protein